MALVAAVAKLAGVQINVLFRLAVGETLAQCRRFAETC